MHRPILSYKTTLGWVREVRICVYQTLRMLTEENAKRVREYFQIAVLGSSLTAQADPE
jgi:hypothetical protein